MTLPVAVRVRIHREIPIPLLPRFLASGTKFPGLFATSLFYSFQHAISPGETPEMERISLLANARVTIAKSRRTAF